MTFVMPGEGGFASLGSLAIIIGFCVFAAIVLVALAAGDILAWVRRRKQAWKAPPAAPENDGETFCGDDSSDTTGGDALVSLPVDDQAEAEKWWLRHVQVLRARIEGACALSLEGKGTIEYDGTTLDFDGKHEGELTNGAEVRVAGKLKLKFASGGRILIGENGVVECGPGGELLVDKNGSVTLIGSSKYMVERCREVSVTVTADKLEAEVRNCGRVFSGTGSKFIVYDCEEFYAGGDSENLAVRCKIVSSRADAKLYAVECDRVSAMGDSRVRHRKCGEVRPSDNAIVESAD